MARTFTISAAGVAMLAAAGAANAADVMPMVATGIPPVAEVAADPEVRIWIDDTLRMHAHPGDIQFSKGLETYFDVEWASGWNLEVGSYGYLDFGSPLYTGGGLWGQLSRKIGGFEVGGWLESGFGCTIPGGCGGGLRGGGFVAYEYETDQLFIRAEVDAQFFPFFDAYLMAEINFDVSETLEVGAYFDLYSFTDWYFYAWAGFDVTETLEIGGSFSLNDSGFNSIGAWARLDRDILDPYVGVWFGGPGDLEAWVGLDLEDQIRNGPFYLIGNVEVGTEFGIGGGPWFNASFGIRYKVGDFEDDFWW